MCKTVCVFVRGRDVRGGGSDAVVCKLDFFKRQPQVLLVRVDPGCTEPSESSGRE